MNTETQILLGMALALMFVAIAYAAVGDVTGLVDDIIGELLADRAPEEVNVSNQDD